MNEIKNATQEKWVLCHNDNDVFHIVHINVGGNLSSGQPKMEQFDTKQELIDRIKIINPNYVIPKKYL